MDASLGVLIAAVAPEPMGPVPPAKTGDPGKSFDDELLASLPPDLITSSLLVPFAPAVPMAAPMAMPVDAAAASPGRVPEATAPLGIDLPGLWSVGRQAALARGWAAMPARAAAPTGPQPAGMAAPAQVASAYPEIQQGITAAEPLTDQAPTPVLAEAAQGQAADPSLFAATLHFWKPPQAVAPSGAAAGAGSPASPPQSQVAASLTDRSASGRPARGDGSPSRVLVSDAAIPLPPSAEPVESVPGAVVETPVRAAGQEEGLAPDSAVALAPRAVGSEEPSVADASDRPSPEAPAQDAPARATRAAQQAGDSPVSEVSSEEERIQPWGNRADDAAGDEWEGLPSLARRVQAREALSGNPAASRPSLTAGGAPLAAPSRAAAAADGAAAGAEAERSRGPALTLGEADDAVPALLVRHAQLAWRDGDQELRVSLRPPELGAIHVAFRAEGQALKGSITVERPEVREWLESRVPAWREELADAGLKVERLDVTLQSRGGQSGQAGPGGQGLPWDGGGAARWGEPQAAQAPAPAPAMMERPGSDAPILGVNVASASGRLDYWA